MSSPRVNQCADRILLEVIRAALDRLNNDIPGTRASDCIRSRILTYVWHLHALITGNPSPSFFKGSIYFPLTSVPGQVPGNDDTPPTPQDKMNGAKPAGAGSYVGLDLQNNVRTMVLLFQDGANSVARAEWPALAAG